MRNLKRMAAFLTALILCLGLSVTAFAAEADTGFSDVTPGPGMLRLLSTAGTTA